MIPYQMEDVFDASSREEFTVVSTFAGGGGSSTGYRLAGGKILLANEFVPEAARTYSENYPETPVAVMDIRSITRKRYVTEWFREHGIKVGELDLLDGSPPCSTFSVAGSMFADKKSELDVAYSDTRQSNIGYLIHDFVYIALTTAPKVIVLENVPAMMPSNNKEKEDDGIFSWAIERLRRDGYLCNVKVLTATDYGVGQIRKRMFLVGVRHDIADKVGLKTEKQLLKEVFPKPMGEIKTLRDVLEGVQIDPRERQTILSATRRSTRYEIIREIPKNPPKVTRLKDVKEGWESDFSVERWSWDVPARTLTQQGVQLSRPNYFHPDEDRPFTINELKRIQGLPDDFVLTGSFDQRAERIGRMVPPLLTAALASQINERIFKQLKRTSALEKQK